MICTNCGKEIQDGASFCPYCGALFADGLVRIHYEAQLESSAETLPVYNAETVRAAWDRQKATIGDDLSAKLDQMTETPSADEGDLGTDNAAADPRVTQDGEHASEEDAEDAANTPAREDIDADFDIDFGDSFGRKRDASSKAFAVEASSEDEDYDPAAEDEAILDQIYKKALRFEAEERRRREE